jgi:thiol-disulfide isomerase/thioredoxin
VRYSSFIIISLLCFTNTILKAQKTQSQKSLEQIHKTTFAKRDSIAELYNIYNDSLKKISDSSAKIQLQKNIDTLDILTEQNNKQELQSEFEFIRENPTSLLTLDIMLYKMRKRDGMNLYDTFYHLYNNLSIALKESDKGKLMKEELADFKNSSVGSEAPDFKLKDINNRELSLSSYRDKDYILIDFWASWCIPCRADFPFLKKIYQKYNSAGFEVINISLDKDIELWKQAIQKDSISIWKQVSIKLNDDSVLKSYFVAAIPVKVLINKDGRIIGRWRGGGEENEFDLAKTLELIFSPRFPIPKKTNP